MSNKKIINETIINKYGSINNFVDKNYTELPLSRTHLYQLANYKIDNPGVFTLEKLAKILELDKQEVIDDYLDNRKDVYDK